MFTSLWLQEWEEERDPGNEVELSEVVLPAVSYCTFQSLSFHNMFCLLWLGQQYRGL